MASPEVKLTPQLVIAPIIVVTYREGPLWS